MATNHTPNPPVDDCSCCGPFLEHMRSGSHIALNLTWEIILGICEVCDNYWHRSDTSSKEWRSISRKEAALYKRPDCHLWHTLRGHRSEPSEILSMEDTSEDAPVVSNILPFIDPAA